MKMTDVRYIFNDVKLVNWKEFKGLYFFQEAQGCRKQVKGYMAAFLFQVKPLLSAAQVFCRCPHGMN